MIAAVIPLTAVLRTTAAAEAIILAAQQRFAAEVDCLEDHLRQRDAATLTPAQT